MILKLLMIASITVMVTDIAQFFQYFENKLSKWLKGPVHIKLLECSLCQTWWLSLFYLIYTNQISILSLFLALLAAILTPQIHFLLRRLQDRITEVIDNI